MEKTILFILAGIVLGGLLVLAYRRMMQRMEERVMEKMAEAQREQQRRQREAAMGVTPPAPQNSHEAILQEMEGIAPEEMESACADVLSQIADRRKKFRRVPTTRRRATKPQ